MKTLKLAPLAFLTLLLIGGCAARQQTSLPDEIEQTEETEAVLGADQPRNVGQEDRANPQAEALARESDLSDHQIAALKRSLGKDAFDQTGAGSWSELPGLTAAHATLPVGSKVEVTNLDNSRRAVVMITDRNPKDGRLIEVSRSAAEQLGMTGSNTAQVGLRVLDRPRGKAAKAAKAAAAKKPKAAPAPRPTRAEEDENAVSAEDRITADEAEGRVSAPKASSKSKSSKSKAARAKAQPAPAKAQAKTKTTAPAKAQAAPAAAGGRYYVQVGSFSSKANAEALVKRLKAQGYGSSRMTESRKDGKTLYRVQAGAFADKARAGAAQGALKGEFPSSYVVGD